jgi:hypothetical protein
MPWLHGIAIHEKWQFIIKMGHFSAGSKLRWFHFKILKTVVLACSSVRMGDILLFKNVIRLQETMGGSSHRIA